MTDHYIEAAKSLEYANEADPGSPTERYFTAKAQVHATLAVADNLAWAFQLADRAEADEDAALATEQLLEETAEPLVTCGSSIGSDCTLPWDHGGICDPGNTPEHVYESPDLQAESDQIGARLVRPYVR